MTFKDEQVPESAFCQDIDEDVDEDLDTNNDVETATDSQVDEIFSPVDTLQPTCRNCGSTEHSSQRKIRRRFCSAWNKYCDICGKRGHSRNVCKPSQEVPEANISPGELAAIYFTLAEASKVSKPGILQLMFFSISSCVT